MEKEQTVGEVVKTATTAIIDFKDHPIESGLAIAGLVVGLLVILGVIKKKPWQLLFKNKPQK